MSDSYEKRSMIEAEVKKIEAESAKIKAQCELSNSGADHPWPFLQWLNISFPYIGVIVGRAWLIHATWAFTLISITWILVVKGWHGNP